MNLLRGASKVSCICFNDADAVAEAFVNLHEKGLVYKGSYLVNWAPGLQTAVSDLEVEYSEENGTLYYFKYPIDGSDETVPIATTRPETILGDTVLFSRSKLYRELQSSLPQFDVYRSILETYQLNLGSLFRQKQ